MLPERRIVRAHERIGGIYRAPLLAARLMLQGRYDFVYDQMRISLRGIGWFKRANLALSGLNLLYRRVHPWSMPLHMQFELTSYCNVRCLVCPTGAWTSSARRAMELSFRQVMAEAGPYLLTASLWGWGESLLHPALADFLRRRKNIGRHFSFDQWAESAPGRNNRCHHGYPPSYLIVAIDGITNETNSHFRVGARLEPIIEECAVSELKQQNEPEASVLQIVSL
jgi:hypothetical protein